jgi:hypothetical protein
MAMTKREQLLRIRDGYRAAHNNEPASAREMADWAVAQEMYKLPVFATARRCAEELADVMRQDHMMVDGGRRVRTMHSWTSEQRTLWDHIRTITRDNMKLSMALKRNGMVGEVKQIKTDLDFFNDLHADEAPLQMSFNFERDLADAGLIDLSSTAPEPRTGQPADAPPAIALKPLPSHLSSRLSGPVQPPPGSSPSVH